MVPRSHAGRRPQVRELRARRGRTRSVRLSCLRALPSWSAVALLLACTWPTSADAIGNLGVYRSLGPADCTAYVADYEAARGADGTVDRENGRFAAHAGFALGYLSAFNAWVVNDIADITDDRPFAELFAWLADHCRAHPDETLVQALEALVSALWSGRDDRRVGKPPWSAGTRTTE